MHDSFPSDCGLVATYRAWGFYRERIPCRMMSILLGPDHPGNGTRHFLLVYRMPTREFFAYDGAGSRCLGLIAKNPDVRDIAAAYDPSGRDAKWVTKMSTDIL